MPSPLAWHGSLVHWRRLLRTHDGGASRVAHSAVRLRTRAPRCSRSSSPLRSRADAEVAPLPLTERLRYPPAAYSLTAGGTACDGVLPNEVLEAALPLGGDWAKALTRLVPLGPDT